MKLLIVYSLAFITLVLNITGCGSNPAAKVVGTPNPCPQYPSGMNYPVSSQSLAGITKQGIWQVCQPESTPVVMNNRLMMVTYQSGYIAPNGTGGVIIYDFLTHEYLGSYWNVGMYGCAFVSNNTLYYFSSATPNVNMVSTTDLVNWTSPVTVWTISSPDNYVMNTSVTQDDKGNFIMAFEVADGVGQDSWRVAISDDLINWKKVGNLFSTDYSACPTVRYVNGAYQFIYLAIYKGNYVSMVAQTQDFINYTIANTILLAPSYGEGINASDVDLVEYQGTVYLVYMNGLQGNPGGVESQMWATYKGTMEDMFTAVWANGGYQNPNPGGA